MFSVENNGDGVLQGSYKLFSVNATIESENQIT